MGEVSQQMSHRLYILMAKNVHAFYICISDYYCELINLRKEKTSIFLGSQVSRESNYSANAIFISLFLLPK